MRKVGNIPGHRRSKQTNFILASFMDDPLFATAFLSGNDQCAVTGKMFLSVEIITDLCCSMNEVTNWLPPAAAPVPCVSLTLWSRLVTTAVVRVALGGTRLHCMLHSHFLPGTAPSLPPFTNSGLRSAKEMARKETRF